MFKLLGEETSSEDEKLYRLKSTGASIEILFTASQAHEIAKRKLLDNYKDIITASGDKDITETRK